MIKFEGSLKGMKSLQKRNGMKKYYPVVGKHIDYTPHVPTIYYSFRVMSGAVGILILMSLLGTIYAFKRTETKKRWFFNLMPWTFT